MVCRCCFHATDRLDNLLILPYNGNILTIGDIMPESKPTYYELCDLVRYLAWHAEYETLPILPEYLAKIEYCIAKTTAPIQSK